MLDIMKYAGYFHDGSIINIETSSNSIIFSMESAEMDPQDMNNDCVYLSRDDRIRGKLHLENIENILENGNNVSSIYMKYESASIFDLEIEFNSIEVKCSWKNYTPKIEINDFSVIKIMARKIWWENVPDLPDPFRKNL